MPQGDGEGDGPSPPKAEDPAIRLGPAQFESVKVTLLDLRRMFIENDLRYEVGPSSFLARPDPSRVAQFPDDRVWPSHPLGWTEKDPSRYRMVDAAGEGFDPTIKNAGFVFTAPLDRAIATTGYSTLLFEKGVGSAGIVTLQSYGTILCKGDLDGKLVLDSYATVVIEGDLAGSIVSNSYATILVLGRMTGSLESKSYANLRVMKGFSGKMSVYDGNNLYLGGHTSSSTLDAIEFKGRATVTMESSDLSSGEHPQKKGVQIRVL